MLNPKAYYNSRPDGFAVLEVVDDNPAPDAPRRFVPLKRTDLAGTVTGPLATLSLTQTFSLDAPAGAVIEALYRFPLPGDAAVTGVRVRFGDIEIQTALKEREAAEADYNLSPSRWVGQVSEVINGELPSLIRQIAFLSDEERKLDERLLALLAPLMEGEADALNP